MEKKFSIPVSMKVNQEQFNYLKEELIKLGYEVTLESTVRDNAGSPNILITQYTHNNNFTNTFDYRDSNYIIQEYNPELFLALASMTNNEEFFVGEYITRIRDSHGILNIGDSAVIINVSERNNDFAITIQNDEIGYKHSSGNIRKATKEEIINHFNKLNMNKLKKLPEKWCIACKDNIEARRYFDKNSTRDCYESNYNYGYLHRFNAIDQDITSPGDLRASFHNDEIRSGYTKITFDQFKELVLKESNMDKKLIGYNLKKDCTQFEQASFAIINVRSTEGNTKFVNENGVDFTEDSLYHDWLKEANVLDLWFEPVYESIKKDVQVPVKASKQLVFIISKDHEGYVKENHENKKVSIQSLADMVNYGFGLHGYSAYKIKPVTFDMGCVKNICTSGIEKVIEAYDEFWGTSHLELPF